MLCGASRYAEGPDPGPAGAWETTTSTANTHGLRDVITEADKVSHKGREGRKGGVSGALVLELSVKG